MHARVLTSAMLLGAISVAAPTAACRSPRQAPPVPTSDFTPHAVLEVRPDPAGWTAQWLDVVAPARADGSNATLPRGSVIQIANASGETIRVQGEAGRTFDTGQLLPGERTTIALTQELAAPTAVQVSVAGSDGTIAELVVTPRPDR